MFNVGDTVISINSLYAGDNGGDDGYGWYRPGKICKILAGEDGCEDWVIALRDDPTVVFYGYSAGSSFRLLTPLDILEKRVDEP